MKQQQTFRGFMFIILMLILLMLALRFPYARQAQTVTAQEFEQILGSGNVAEAVISPNPQTPSGYVTVTLANGQTVRQNVSDVKDAEQLLKDNSIDYSMEDVPQENTLLTVVMPFMLSIVVVVVIVTMMNRGAAGGGSNARMMNFGRSRAKLSRDSKVNFTNVAGLEEEKEELEKQLKKMKRIMAGYQEFLRLPEIRPLHIEFVERKRTEQLQRQQEEERQRQEQEARDRERRQARSARGMRMR